MAWREDAKTGQIVAGGNKSGNRNNQLNNPIDVIVDKENDSLVICDGGNRRVMRWPRQNGTQGQTIISNISCYGLTMDDNGYLYVSDSGKNEVRQWKIGDTHGTVVVAGGNGEGDRLDQLSCPTFIFVGNDHSLYVSDYNNHRVMKWVKGAKEGIVVAGGQGKGNSLTQLSNPGGIAVDQLGTVYVADYDNHRVMRWLKGAKKGRVIVDGNSSDDTNQLFNPSGLSLDRWGNLYIANRDQVQKFNIDLNSNT
jgi:sugar lactone lactonase YvrE